MHNVKSANIEYTKSVLTIKRKLMSEKMTSSTDLEIIAMIDEKYVKFGWDEIKIISFVITQTFLGDVTTLARL